MGKNLVVLEHPSEGQCPGSWHAYAGPAFTDSPLDQAFPPAQVKHLGPVIVLTWQIDVFAEANIEAFTTLKNGGPYKILTGLESGACYKLQIQF